MHAPTANSATTASSTAAATAQHKPSPSAAASSADEPRVDGGVALTRSPCQSTLPAAWQSALRQGVLWHGLPDTEAPGAPAPEGGAVLHQYNHAGYADIALVGAGQRIVQRVATLARTDGAQFAYTAVTANYIAFIYALTSGQQAQSLWDLYLFNRATGKLTLVTHSPRDAHGNPLQSGWVDPILTGRYLLWIQGAQTGLPWGGSEVRVYDLASGTTRVLYRGLAQAATVMGLAALFTAVVPNAPKSATNPPMTLEAVDLATGRPVPAPTGVTAPSDNAFSLRYDAGTLIWNTSTGQLRGWRADWGRSITLLPGNTDVWPLGQKIGTSGAGYPRIYRHFVVVHDGVTMVLDLRTNSLAVLSTNAGAEDTSGSTASVSQYSTSSKPAFGEAFSLDVTVFSLAGLPDLSACS